MLKCILYAIFYYILKLHNIIANYKYLATITKLYLKEIVFNMKNFIHSKKCIYFLLVIIILTGIGRFSYAFFVEKQGTHSDEEWSFGLANSYYEPYIYSSDDDQYSKNNNQWLSGDVLKNYLTVQKGERFSFGSVYYNMSCDMHPPLYFFVLHFLSSFFVDQYVPALALLINLICYVILSIYLYRLLCLMSKSRILGLLGVFFNTFAVGTLSMAIYMRMYMMVAMFAVMLVYYNGVLYYSNDITTKKWSIYIKLAVTTCLGALTHHFFLPFAFIIAAIMCIYFLIKKNWSVLLKYSIFMIIGVGLSIAIFPATLDHMFGIQTFAYRDTGNYSEDQNITNGGALYSQSPSNSFTTDGIENYAYKIFRYYFFTCLSMAFTNILGFSPVSPYKTNAHAYIISLFIILIILCAFASFLFRKDKWFINLKEKMINKTKSLPRRFINFIKHINWFIIAIIFSILFITAVCSYRVNVIAFGIFTTRYLFIIYPILALIIIYCMYIFIKWLFHKRGLKIAKFICTILLCCLVIANNIIQVSPYLWKSSLPPAKNELPTLTKDADIVIVSSNQWLLTVYSPLIDNCNFFYYTTYDNFFKNINVINEFINQSNKNTYLILDTSSIPISESELYSDAGESKTLDNMNFKRALFQTTDKINIRYKDTYINEIEQISPDYTYLKTVTDYGINMELYKLK